MSPPAGRSGLDVQRLQESFARMAMHGDAVPLFFYSDLFLRHPEVRDLFPVSMAAQRDRLVHALGRIVADVEHVDALGGYLQGLGREHRKFGAIAEYYPYVGASLVATVAHFNRPRVDAGTGGRLEGRLRPRRPGHDPGGGRGRRDPAG